MVKGLVQLTDVDVSMRNRKSRELTVSQIQSAGMLMGAPTPDSARVDRDAREPNSSPWKNLALNFSRTWTINQEPSTLQLSVKCTWCAVFPKENSEC
jgi:hypothetical protein